MWTLRWPAYSRLALLALGMLVTGSACDDAERQGALEARIAELERRTTDTAKAIEPLADVPNAIEQQQREMAALRDGHDAVTARLAGIDAAILALERATKAAAPTDPAPPEIPIDAGAAEPVEVGIAECDAYIRKYVVCIRDKMPAESRAAMIDAMVRTSATWRDAASGPARTALATACKEVDASSREALKSIGCTW